MSDANPFGQALTNLANRLYAAEEQITALGEMMRAVHARLAQLEPPPPPPPPQVSS